MIRIIEGMMDLPINKNKRPLVFKGGREAFGIYKNLLIQIH